MYLFFANPTDTPNNETIFPKTELNSILEIDSSTLQDFWFQFRTGTIGKLLSLKIFKWSLSEPESDIGKIMDRTMSSRHNNEFK